MMRRFSNIIILVLFTTIGACGKSTNPVKELLALERFLQIPEVPAPPLTTENQDNPWFIAASNSCYDVQYYRNLLVGWVEFILREDLPSTQSNGQFSWTIPHEDGLSYTVFYVQPTDSLLFEITQKGPAFTMKYFPEPDSLHWTGHINPTNTRGRMMLERWELSFWWHLKLDLHLFSRRYGQVGATVQDSLNGAGKIEVWFVGPLAPVLLEEGAWDAIGHGWYQNNSGQGSW